MEHVCGAALCTPPSHWNRNILSEPFVDTDAPADVTNRRSSVCVERPRFRQAVKFVCLLSLVSQFPVKSFFVRFRFLRDFSISCFFAARRHFSTEWLGYIFGCQPFSPLLSLTDDSSLPPSPFDSCHFAKIVFCLPKMVETFWQRCILGEIYR